MRRALLPLLTFTNINNPSKIILFLKKKEKLEKMSGLRVYLWIFGLMDVVRTPTASSPKGARVYCGCQPGPTRVALHPGRDGGGTRAPALRSLDDYVLRFRGDEEYGLIPSHPSSTCSWLRSGRPRDHVHILPLSDLIHLFIRGLLTRARHHVA